MSPVAPRSRGFANSASCCCLANRGHDKRPHANRLVSLDTAHDAHDSDDADDADYDADDDADDVWAVLSAMGSQFVSDRCEGLCWLQMPLTIDRVVSTANA